MASIAAGLGKSGGTVDSSTARPEEAGSTVATPAAGLEEAGSTVATSEAGPEEAGSTVAPTVTGPEETGSISTVSRPKASSPFTKLSVSDSYEPTAGPPKSH